MNDCIWGGGHGHPWLVPVACEERVRDGAGGDPQSTNEPYDLALHGTDTICSLLERTAFCLTG